MSCLAKPAMSLMIAMVILAGGAGATMAEGLPQPVCNLVIHGELAELGDARIAVSIARADFAAYLKIYGMIEGLWKAEAVNRMTYVEAKHNRDAAAVALEQADLLLERQALLVEQYRMICESRGSDSKERSRTIREDYLRYRKADCNTLSKSIDVAAINLDYQREFLTSILDLQEGNVATKADVILAELEVEREEKRHSDAKARTAACRSELAGLEGPPGS